MREPAAEVATETANSTAGHCPTCSCEPSDTDTLTVYPPNELFYGRCKTCGQVRWETHHHTDHRGRAHKSVHCGCCTHPHDLKYGGHTIPTKGKS